MGILESQYPDYNVVPLEVPQEFSLVNKKSGGRLLVSLKTSDKTVITRRSIACKVVADAVFHKVLRKGEYIWVVDGQAVH